MIPCLSWPAGFDATLIVTGRRTDLGPSARRAAISALRSAHEPQGSRSPSTQLGRDHL
jgi:hypothetical protein